MVEIVTKLSSKNQVTLPAEARKALGVGAHDRVAFVVEEDGSVQVRRPKYTIRSLVGSFPAMPGASDDLRHEIYEATEEEINRRHPEWRKQ
ncbi:MAG: AbrB/MazE/SpoVT family DNA-binding domain-containing protein [Thermomicrobiales bacterium]|nr:AbrB/MazE/SpoVT family DNA-binding domain-containing protein [Thermomicrobiales bacterium]